MVDILLYNYWEHIKREKELSFIFPPEHPKRIEIRLSTEKVLEKLKTMLPEQLKSLSE